jgi:hypothetical protein
MARTGGHGGARTGAGRKKGGLTGRTREVAEKIAARGKTPLEVMITIMRRAERKKDDAMALDAAKAAAPYMHPRLASVEHSGPNGGPIETAQVSPRDRIARRLACLAPRGGAEGDTG